VGWDSDCEGAARLLGSRNGGSGTACRNNVNFFLLRMIMMMRVVVATIDNVVSSLVQAMLNLVDSFMNTVLDSVSGLMKAVAEGVVVTCAVRREVAPEGVLGILLTIFIVVTHLALFEGESGGVDCLFCDMNFLPMCRLETRRVDGLFDLDLFAESRLDSRAVLTLYEVDLAIVVTSVGMGINLDVDVLVMSMGELDINVSTGMSAFRSGERKLADDKAVLVVVSTMLASLIRLVVPPHKLICMT
jgi:hypothetical protein